MDDELELAQLEYVEARLSEMRASLKELETALGIAMNAETVDALMLTIVERLRRAGNAPLAEEFRGSWGGFLNAVSVLMRAMMGNDDAESESAMERADEAERDFRTVIADAVEWLKGRSGFN